MILLSTLDLALAALLVLILGLLSWRMQLGLQNQLFIAAVRTTVQLLLIGLVLKYLFEQSHPALVVGVAFIMLLAAAWEVRSRQSQRLRGWQSFGIGALAMFISSFSITLLALWVIIGAQPWYDPQYLIPVLGMLLGNTMTGIALALERLNSSAVDQRAVIEQRLMLGESPRQALQGIMQDSARSGLIPIINAMAAAGLVSLPGMMTGQILAGSPPVEAVKYQILIMFLIAGGTGLGTLTALHINARRLFDERARLRLDRLIKSD